MIGTFAQHEIGPRSGGQDVLIEVRLIDRAPDRAGHSSCRILGKMSELAEVRRPLAERGVAKLLKSLDV